MGPQDEKEAHRSGRSCLPCGDIPGAALPPPLRCRWTCQEGMLPKTDGTGVFYQRALLEAGFNSADVHIAGYATLPWFAVGVYGTAAG